jgi:carbon storage regulator CsrA
MLVLSRKIGESILVPQFGLSLTVVAVKGKTVRLAFSAPPEIEIVREEILHQVRPPARRPPAEGPAAAC